MKIGPAFLLFGLLLSATPALAQVADRDRAVRNYVALQRGELRLADLTPFERQEVAEVDRIIRAQTEDRSTPAERCRRQAMRGRADPPSDLERRLVELRCSQH